MSGRERDRRVAKALRAAGRTVRAGWDQLLVPPEVLRTGAGEPYRVYGPYLRSWRRALESQDGAAGPPEPLPAPAGLRDLDPASLAGERRTLWDSLPLIEAVPEVPSFAGAELCPCRPGEAAAVAVSPPGGGPCMLVVYAVPAARTVSGSSTSTSSPPRLRV